MHYAARRVPAFEPERELSVSVRVEAHPEPVQLLDGAGRLAREDLDGRRAARAATRLQGVIRVALG